MPERILLMTGYSCNNNCIFCSANSHGNSGVNKSTDELKKDIVSNSSRSRKIVLIGGEFTIRKDAVSLIALCRSSGYREISIETNGRMFSNKAFADSLVGAGLTDVCFSLHGATARTHDGLTRVKGSFSQSLRGLENAGGHNMTVTVNFVVTRYNLRELPRFISRMAGYDFIDRIVVSFVRPPMWEYDRHEFLKMVPRYTAAADIFRKNTAPGRVSFQYLPLCFSDGLDVIQQRRKKGTFNLSVGSAQRGDLYSSLMNEFMFPEVCRQCAKKEHCGGITIGYFRLYGADELRPFT